MLVNAPEFATYTKVGETTKDLGVETADLHHIVTKHDTFNYHKERILQLLQDNFEFVAKAADDLQEVL